MYLPEFFSKIKHNNINLVGISVDHNEADWKKAVQEDKSLWLQLLENKENGLSDQLEIAAFPTYLVTDNDLKILHESNDFFDLQKFITGYIERKQ